MSPVSYKRFCDTEDVEVPWEEITRGYEYEKDQYVEITDEDLDKADVEFTKTIQIMEFVQEDEIDPVYFDKPYYLEPQKGGERAYALMREALAQSKTRRHREGGHEDARTSCRREDRRQHDHASNDAICPRDRRLRRPQPSRRPKSPKRKWIWPTR